MLVLRAARLWLAVRRAHSIRALATREVIPPPGDMRGVVLEPSSWQELIAKIQENTVESLGTLGRTPVEIEVYREFRRQVCPGCIFFTLYIFSAGPTVTGIVFLVLTCFTA